MLAEAEAEIETLPAPAAVPLHNAPNVVFVDLRDPREIDPESPYHKPIFAEDKRFVFYCAAGWRSALAAKTALDMGLEKVAHVGGGFGAWREAGGPTETMERRK